LGWVEGQNIAIERRYAEENADRLAALAAELVQLRVDVIVSADPRANGPAKRATSTIPIVMAMSAGSHVASLGRPGGNITGLSESYGELVPKWLELLKEAVPQASRVGVLTIPPFWPVQDASWEALEKAAKTRRVEVHDPSAFAGAFTGMTRKDVGALIVLPHPLLFRHRTRLVAIAAESHLPTIWGPFREFVEAGGLMAYGPSLREQYRRAAVYVDKILKGAKPADLPIEQPTKYELVINLKTAKALGLTIPPSLLLRADQVIE
jgi:putative ABC transport system substrate-binding protein